VKNPIIERELIGMLRTRKALALQVCVALAFALLVVLSWPTDALVDLSGSQSRQVFQLFGYGLLATLILLVPVFPATSIVRERIGGTLALLLNSPMKPWSIYLGKLSGVLGFILLLLVLSFPGAAACYAMGGVEAANILQLYGLLVLVSIQYAALGLLIAATPNRPIRPFELPTAWSCSSPSSHWDRGWFFRVTIR
jgi:ABC-type transport system involved in multi-copper enzyme maturation permease subunit